MEKGDSERKIEREVEKGRKRKEHNFLSNPKRKRHREREGKKSNWC